MNDTRIYTPSSYLPIIREVDYTIGYIDRFFVSRKNLTDLMETNARDFNLCDRKYYNKLKIKWKIAGPEYNVYNSTGKILEYTGVVNYNTLRINDLKLIFPNVLLVLNNPKQFWRGF